MPELIVIVICFLAYFLYSRRTKGGRNRIREAKFWNMDGKGRMDFNMGKLPKLNWEGNMPKLRGPAAALLLLFFTALLASGSYYKVSEQEQAVVTMFGQVIRTDSAGLYWKLPFVQSVHKVDTTTSGMPIGYTLENGSRYDGDNAYSDTVPSEAMMITSDFNFVNVDFYLEYRVSNPVQYLYASSDPEGILRNEAQSAIRSTIAKYSVDDVITTGKSQIQAEVRDKLIAALEENDIGIQVVNVLVQDAEPPTSEVLAAFKAVETAKQGAQTAGTQAQQYRNERIPAAEANADKTRQTAEAAKQARIAEATGQVERFNRMYEEYSKYPLVTKQRLFYETIEDVLPELKVIITDGKTATMYPLDSFSEAVTQPSERTEG
ncbi:FtsH protease activity modulator HflK [Oribacterium sp. oral taxon 102]|uniref:FtsH protease activity modulator HflK n=1 Tax=Oribacterium sp. oral taxon 102 TaxID=671214 RepID=UPI001FAC9C3F|nr:FtsH protease activity modulator HflK [Oribacterium sp. oral taxon 102]